MTIIAQIFAWCEADGTQTVRWGTVYPCGGDCPGMCPSLLKNNLHPCRRQHQQHVRLVAVAYPLPQRYNTLYFALPAIKRLRRLMASLGDCRQSLSLVRRCRTSCKAVCQGDAFPVGSSATKPPVSLDSSGQRERRPLWIPRPKEGRHPPLVSSQKTKQNVPANKHIPFCFY